MLAAIGNKTVAENATLTITPSASDADGDTLTYTTGALPAGATFVGGVFSWTPTFAQAGSYPAVTFTATDNGTPVLSASEAIAITVTNTNRAPVLGDRRQDGGRERDVDDHAGGDRCGRRHADLHDRRLPAGASSSAASSAGRRPSPRRATTR